MIVYLRDRNGANQRTVIAESWDYHTDNSHDSKVTVTGTVSGYEGGTLLITNPIVGDPFAGVISAITNNDGTTDIAVKPVISLFDRKVPYVAGTNMGTFLSNAITSNFGSGQTDTMFKYSWLTIEITDTGTYSAPTLDDFDYYDLNAYIKEQESAGRIILKAEPTDGGIKIKNVSYGTSNVFFDNSNYELKSESYSSSVVSKITNRLEDGTSDVWYLFDDGTCSKNPASGTRVEGSWEIENDLDDDGIANKFSKAQYEHKVSFYSKKLMRYGQRVRFRMKDGRIVNSLITCVCIKSDDDRIYYECGNLKTTLTEILGGLRNG